jgi:Integrase core domain
MIRHRRPQGSAHARVADPVALESGLIEGQAGLTSSSPVATLTGFVAQTEFSHERSPLWDLPQMFIDPGSPWQSAWIESFKGRMPEEHLNGQVFEACSRLRFSPRGLRIDYNNSRPHSAPGWITPAQRIAPEPREYCVPQPMR